MEPSRKTPAYDPGFISEKDRPALENVTSVDSTLPEIDPVLDRAITRKFDAHLLPWLFGLWLLAFIDRSNIGNARIDGLATDLHLTGDKFNIVGPPAWIACRCTNAAL